MPVQANACHSCQYLGVRCGVNACGFGAHSTVDVSHCCSQNSYDKLLAEVPKYKMITPSVLSDRLRVRHYYH